jgi:hypothetical protein
MLDSWPDTDTSIANRKPRDRSNVQVLLFSHWLLRSATTSDSEFGSIGQHDSSKNCNWLSVRKKRKPHLNQPDRDFIGRSLDQWHPNT